MQFKYSLGVISLCSALFLVGCNDDNSSVSQTPTVQEQKQKLQPIIIQGALPVESERMASKLENKTVEKIGGWTFWKGTYNGYPMIISKTRMGMSNS
ncbi:phosphorylase family protein, partial [Acinetobacter baumannii]|nr:5'-methylthioadenosine nucleosidase [Acinetobacter baumannii]